MTLPLISVIVPVYRAEAYLSRCLSSLCTQTYPEWEAICIDDGSPDNSLDILRDYAARDTRIRVLHQENQGVSAARNAGLDQVQGKYFCMLDADDEFEPRYLAELVEPVLKEEADCVVSGFTYIQAGKKCRQSAGPACVLPHNTPDASARLPKGVSGHLYRTEILRACGARFPLGVRYGEDTAFHYMMFPFCHRIAIVESYGYLYYCNRESLSQNKESGRDPSPELAGAVEALASFYASKPSHAQLRSFLVYFSLHAMRRILSTAPIKAHGDCSARIRKAMCSLEITKDDFTPLRHREAAVLSSVLQGGYGHTLGFYLRRFLRAIRGKHRNTTKQS